MKNADPRIPIPPAAVFPAQRNGEYAIVRRAIAYLAENWRNQPSLDRIARRLDLPPGHLHRVFTRRTGLTPKGFLQALTLDHARRLLRDSASILETSHEVGLSGPGRLHDLFVTHEAMPPGIYKAGGAGLSIAYGFHDSPFGRALLMVTDRGLAGLAFADEGAEAATLADMMRRWPRADYVEDGAATAPWLARVFDRRQWRAEIPLRVVMIGSDFEIRIWTALLHVPFGRVTSYSDIARHIGKPGAARAVGAAIGRNPVSFVVPCHRVLARSGRLAGYHWGLTRKRAILGWEAGLLGELS